MSNAVIVDFINRNYAHDAVGCWYFQNGPQRVFVAIDYTPFVYRLDAPHPGAPPRIVSHTGLAVTRVEVSWIYEAAVMLLATELAADMRDARGLDRLLPCFTDESGTALTEDIIAETTERLQAGGDTRLHFHYLGYTLPVSPIKAGDVPFKFGFVQWPRAPTSQEP